MRKLTYNSRLASLVPKLSPITKQGERLHGLDLGSDVKFVGKARRFLTDVGFEYAEGCDLGDWQCVSDGMVALRDRLRQTKA
jgi:hypothetical protein